MHFAIRYLTEYRYDAQVTDNLNSLRVRPATNSTQRCDEFHTRIEPEARVSRHLDYFGTALAGRGTALNRTLASLPGLFGDLPPVMRTVAAPDTQLQRLLTETAEQARKFSAWSISRS